MEVPLSLSGYLLRQSPLVLHFGTYQQRFFTLERGRLYWSSQEGTDGRVDPASLSGCIDFSANPCDVKIDPESKTKFSLEPRGGSWLKGDFTGSDSGRIFRFDASKCKYRRERWLEAFRAHIRYGQALRRNARASAAARSGNEAQRRHARHSAGGENVPVSRSKVSTTRARPKVSGGSAALVADVVIRDATPDEIAESLRLSALSIANEDDVVEEIECDIAPQSLKAAQS
eukprot:TRINITY_DN1897_c1_g1_i1.p1 TRINITY_DN1897_c1_g1~~TRINITY_DN1897_c1_g1_i1.p1  ORF type:complete len:230 (+),score=26.05 TRINITY_DN1897_c1_g1_i1:57-746(+)